MCGQVGEDDWWEAGAGEVGTRGWRQDGGRWGLGGGYEGDRYESDYGSENDYE